MVKDATEPPINAPSFAPFIPPALRPNVAPINAPETFKPRTGSFLIVDRVNGLLYLFLAESAAIQLISYSFKIFQLQLDR